MSVNDLVGLAAVVLGVVISPVTWATVEANEACQRLGSPDIVQQISPDTSQIMVVQSLGGIHANMTLCQRHRAIWKPVYTPSFKAVIGKNGLAAMGAKKEGDLKTPMGLYPIGEAFGSQPLAVKMDYRYITAQDKFIDDVNSHRYNTWVTGKTDAKSDEPMLRESYRYGAVVNYNMNPTVPGAGSAIFIHLWRSPTSPTAGCIAMEEKDIITMLHWLDKNQHPYIVIRAQENTPK